MESRLKLKSGRAAREKWRILDGKGGEWCVFMFGALNVLVPLESIKDYVSWALIMKH
jgi:hypothetical protein